VTEKIGGSKETKSFALLYSLCLKKQIIGIAPLRESSGALTGKAGGGAPKNVPAGLLVCDIK